MKGKKYVGFGLLVIAVAAVYNGGGTRFFERVFEGFASSNVAKRDSGGLEKTGALVKYDDLGSGSFYTQLNIDYQRDVLAELGEYGIGKSSIVWQTGVRGPIVAWLNEPIKLDLVALKRLARPLYVPEEGRASRVDKRAEVVAHVVKYQSMPINQLWLGYEDGENYYFSGGGSRPIFDYSAGIIVEKETGAIYYWVPGMRHASDRPVLKKIERYEPVSEPHKPTKAR